MARAKAKKVEIVIDGVSLHLADLFALILSNREEIASLRDEVDYLREKVNEQYWGL